jgi:alpha-galactosidase
MRLDYKWLSLFSLVSTSDQINYLKYPYLAGNLLSAVLPEQAAVWSYPVTEDCTGEDISDERIYINMINSFLGRMHLASHLELMNEEQLAVIMEGVAYYDTLTEAKKTALPYLPMGFTQFGADKVVAGFKTEQKIYLAVWCIGEAKRIDIPVQEQVKNVEIAYPSKPAATCVKTESGLAVEFTRSDAAVFLEISL